MVGCTLGRLPPRFQQKVRTSNGLLDGPTPLKKISSFLSKLCVMHLGLFLLQQECVSLAKKLRDTFALQECERLIDRTSVHSSVMEYAASTLVANLAYRVAHLDEPDVISLSVSRNDRDGPLHS